LRTTASTANAATGVGTMRVAWWSHAVRGRVSGHAKVLEHARFAFVEEPENQHHATLVRQSEIVIGTGGDES
jgi:hypothetical protein